MRYRKRKRTSSYKGRGSARGRSYQRKGRKKRLRRYRVSRGGIRL